MPEGPSLRIGFGTSRTHAFIEAAEEHRAALSRLALGIPGASRPSPLSLEVPIDELLAGIAALSSWPDKQGVEWEESFREYILSGIRDGQEAEGRISGDGAAQQRVAEDEVPGLLGEDW